ncbi:MAG: hypothetical protein JXX29_02140 [Deltaproteobacteria bacterium]|nr:hypothetical protein [Deltaproteobacteria bacterium]MBN2670442.1 hypothetical protein [Deltaproteobacteria bacterium]
MKNRLTLCSLLILSLLGCGEKDNSAIEQRVAALEKKVTELESELKACQESDVVPMAPVEEKIDALIQKVDALQTPVAKPVPLAEPDTEAIPKTPSQSNSESDETVQIGLSKSEVDKIMAGVRQQVQLCGFQPGSVITFSVRVANTGRVSDVTPQPPHRDTPVGRCAAKVLYRLVFPATGSSVKFSHTFSF